MSAFPLQLCRPEAEPVLPSVVDMEHYTASEKSPQGRLLVRIVGHDNSKSPRGRLLVRIVGHDSSKSPRGRPLVRIVGYDSSRNHLEVGY